MSVSYSRDLRARADADGKVLASVDTETDGCRWTTQGPATEAQARFLLWAGVAATGGLSDRQLDELRRVIKKKLERRVKRAR